MWWQSYKHRGLSKESQCWHEELSEWYTWSAKGTTWRASDPSYYLKTHLVREPPLETFSGRPRRRSTSTHRKFNKL